MKSILLVLSLLLSSQALALTSLSYQDSITVRKTIVHQELPAKFIKLYRPVTLEEKRMIAGDFESVQKKSSKETYLDGLRSKLQGSKGLARY